MITNSLLITYHYYILQKANTEPETIISKQYYTIHNIIKDILYYYYLHLRLMRDLRGFPT